MPLIWCTSAGRIIGVFAADFDDQRDASEWLGRVDSRPSPIQPPTARLRRQQS
jgi:hypothetical protein